MNKQIFDTSKATYKEHLNRLLETLLTYNLDSENDFYNDIHIYQEDVFICVEWATVPYSKEYGGSFIYVDEDERVMKEVEFPDGHYEYVFPEDVNQALKGWKEDHPEWQLTYYGTWTNIEENRIKYIDMFLKKDSTIFQCASSSSYEKFIETLKEDRKLHRTDYIVCNNKTAKKIINLLTKRIFEVKEEFSVNKDSTTFKYAILSIILDKQIINDLKTDQLYKDSISVYVCEDIKDNEFALCSDNDKNWFYKF